MGLDIQEVIEQAIDVTGGVRSNVEPYYLEKNQMYYFQNVDLDDLGARKKRDGCSSYGTAGSELGGLAPWVFKNQDRYISGFWDNHSFITDGDYSWSQADSTGISLITEHVLHGTFGRVLQTSSSTTITLGLISFAAPSAGAVFDCLEFDGKLVAANTSAGLSSFKISSTGTLTEVDQDDQGGTATHLADDGNFIYAANSTDGVETYLLTEDALLVHVSNTDVGNNHRGVACDTNVSLTFSCGSGLLHSYTSAEGVLSIASTITLVDGGSAYGLALDRTNGIAFVACRGDGVFSVSYDAAGALSLVDSDDQGGSATDVCFCNNYLYVANDTTGIEIYSTDSGGNLTWETNDTTDNDVSDIDSDGDFIYSVDSDSDVVRMYNAYDGANFSLVSTYSLAAADQPFGVHCGATLIFVSDRNNNKGAISMVGGSELVTSTDAQTAQFIHSIYPSTSNPTLSALSIIPESGIGSVNASIHPRSVEWWQGRLWFAGLVDDGAYSDAIYWSTILNGIDIDLSNNVRIDAEQGDEIMKILPVRSNKPRMYVFKRHSVHALDVVWTSGAQIPTTENTLDTTNSNVIPLTHDVGTVAPNSVVYASGAGDSDVFFLARDGVRSLKRVEQDTAGGAGPPISEPIKDIIDRINWTYAEKATSAIFDHKLYMAIPVDGSTFNNTTIVYDLEKQRWVGEYTLTPTDMITANFNDEGEKLFGAWHYTTSETVGSATTATSGRHVFHMLDDSVSLDPSNTAVEYIEETKAYSFGHLGKKKRWNWAEFEFTPAETTITISVYAKREDEDYKLINYLGIEPKLVYPILPAALPWDLSNTAKTIERISLMDIDVGRSLQIKLVTNSPGAFGTRTTRVAAWPLHEIWE